MKLRLLLLLILFASPIAHAQIEGAFDQHDTRYASKYLNDIGSEEVVRAWFYYVLTKNDSARYVLRVYNPDVGVMTHYATYKDAQLRNLDGVYREWFDNNQPRAVGQFKNGLKDGDWTFYSYNGRLEDYSSRMAHFNDGNIHGGWETIEQAKVTRLTPINENRNEETYNELDSFGNRMITSRSRAAAKLDTSRSETVPEYVGGHTALLKFLSDNIRYPERARRLHIEGRAIIGFVLNEEGFVKNIVIKRGLCKEISDECRRMMEIMPPWRPGKQNGKTVRTYFQLPILFGLIK